MVERGPFPGKCIGASIKGDLLETTVWSDISRFLSDPGSLIDELLAESDDAQTRAAAEAERVTLTAARDAAQDRRKRAIELYTHGKVSEVEFDAIAAEVDRELETLDERLADLQGENDALDDSVPTEEVLSEIRKRLDGGLSQAERQEIVQLLVRQITVHTTVPEQGRKQVRIVIDYRVSECSEDWHGHRCESRLQSLTRYRRLSCNSLTTHLIRLPPQPPVSLSSSSHS